VQVQVVALDGGDVARILRCGPGLVVLLVGAGLRRTVSALIGSLPSRCLRRTTAVAVLIVSVGPEVGRAPDDAAPQREIMWQDMVRDPTMALQESRGSSQATPPSHALSESFTGELTNAETS
jgi:hypothetical protein